MNKATANVPVGYLPSDRPPAPALIGLAFQHLVTMFPATVLVAVLTHFDVSVTLFGSGVATILSLWLSSRLTGSPIPLYYGSSFAYIAPVVAITVANIHGIADPEDRIRLAQGGIVLTGLLNVLVGITVRYLGKGFIDRFLPAEVTGSVAIVIGIALAFAALSMAGAHWGIALVTLLTTIMCSVYLRGRGFLGMIPVLLGVAAGYLTTIVFVPDLLNWVPVEKADWFRIPPFTFPTFTWSALIAIAPIAIATIPESTAHLYQISLYVDKLAHQMGRPPLHLSRRIGINLVCDGIGDTINGMFGGCAGTNYGENNSLMTITRNFSGPVLALAGGFALLLAFVGKLAALIGTLPVAVTGGLSIYLFGTIGAQGIALQLNQRVNLFDPRKLAIVSVILVVGIGGSIGYEGGMIPVFNYKLPAIATAAVLGILLNALFQFIPARQLDAEFADKKVSDDVEV